MTGGAKTGTPRKLCLYCQCPVANQKEWDEIPEGEGDHLCWGECNERNDVDSLLRKSRSDLTEALKVVVEAETALINAEKLILVGGFEHGSTHREVKSALAAFDSLRKEGK